MPADAKPNLGQVASTSAIVPLKVPTAPVALLAFPASDPAGSSGNGLQKSCEANPEGQSPAFIRLGSTCLVPVGFMDLTSVWRDKNAGSSMGSNFGSIPFNNAVNGNLSEFHFTPQNSRVGFRFDGDWRGTHVIGYSKVDFNGTSGSNAIAVSNSAFVPRLRLFWADVRKGKMEYLVGPELEPIDAQPYWTFRLTWRSLLYASCGHQLRGGLTWTRQPGARTFFSSQR